ncbi:probable multidrug resistance-associated protein lethal(2)03659 [Culicoides brevitarsis]|uniref:probable multidrug resistance-associated protein lethal(2)03659 n=1 Tax=Culicoides brevitarsis TaxID=469753 RepID=UPI00307BD6FB
METDKRNQRELPPCPREKANIFSYVLFIWILPIFWKGRKKDLDTDDLYQPMREHKSETLGDRLCKAWDQECEKKQALNKPPSLLSTMTGVFKWQLAFGGVMLFILEFAVRMTQPIFIGGLVNYYSKVDGNINEAYLYAGGIILCTALNLLIIHPFMLGQSHLGMKIRISAISMIYRKSLRLTKNALGNTTSGQVVNLLSNDVGRFDTSILFIHYLWISPLEILAVTIILYYQIEWSAFAGVGFLLGFMPIQMYIGKLAATLRLKTAMRTDERVRFMNEIVQGIQVIKMYAWEKPFAKVVEMARLNELKAIKSISYIRGIMLSFMMFTSRTAIFLSLMTYVLLGQILTAEKAFVVTAYYNLLRTSAMMLFPQGIVQATETIVSVRRIQTFMMHPELPRSKEQLERNRVEKEKADLNMSNSNGTPAPPPSNVVVKISNVTAKWDPKYTENTLNNVNLNLEKQKLIAVIGPVGSGKSSLIQAILGELSIDSGSIDVNGDVSFASQEPWLFSSSIRQNILFGMPYDKKRYQEVVKVCALERDFTLFPNADKTLVGERGASLSGGQKARINLARAVYRDADIYFLDDPLSAVDAHVGRHLFDECIKNYLRKKAVILVTHQLQYLQSAHQIVIMEHGNVKATGTYDELSKSGLDFAKLLNNAEEETETVKRQLSRQDSVLSHESDLPEKRVSVMSVMSDGGPVAVAETSDTGSIGFAVYKQYFKALGGWGIFIVVFFLFVFSQVLASGGDYFLTYWTNKEQQKIVEQTSYLHRFVRATDGFWHDFNQFFKDLYAYEYFDLYAFALIILLTIVVSLGRSFVFFNAAMKASANLHNAMFMGISRASMYFFNTNPSGRILNRFSKDMGQVDEILPAIMIDMIQIFLTLVGIVTVVAIVNPWYILPTAVLVVLFYFLRVFYLKTSIDIKRIEAITRSPIYSHLGASLSGLSTIRAFKAEQMLIDEFDAHQDLHSSAFYLFLAAGRAFGFWLDGSCLIYITLITMSFFLMGENGGNVGLVITQILGMTGMVQWGMRQSAELENTMTAVERVVEYHSVDPEGALESKPDKKPPATWPENGRIVFDNLSMRYAPDPKTECVLRELEFVIEPREKIGIVGRTGAGKSSLINALFRLSYNEGSILIDTRNTADMGLHDLRAKISIIPQEPVLFSGTLRYNLDPFDEYTDDKLWMSLEEVKLKEAISELPLGLLSKISEGGSNFSVGQRQLVCLARAILRDNKVLVMDEATANVDPQTDALIQETIRTKFADCTVLTIAHRLNTVMDSDKVLVMDAGRAIEFGPPYELLTTNEGPMIFHGMVKQTGNASFEQLLEVAKQSYEKNSSKKDN